MNSLMLVLNNYSKRDAAMLIFFDLIIYMEVEQQFEM